MANRKRPGRIRTKRNNRREPLLLSTLAPEDFNVRPGEAKSIACPDCRTWRRIMGNTDLKIREHGVPSHVPGDVERATCPGSNQIVVIDIDVRRWQARQDRLLRDAMPQEIRRSARQHYKPIPAPAPALVQIAAKSSTAEPADSRPLWLLREMKWASTASAVSETDTRRAQLPSGDAPLGSPAVPLTTLHPRLRER
ncbi:hypothetical protein [Streptomyces griseorubiginosus]|uniref:Uncharacterized protein n=1 Tax=Streptomyces griseorubiginosus TaxID=67304 RepID=A0A117QWT6_9ACTN|nr:hypothetical protein [Streptomyces griseorubiginosus]KUN58423.1 hypothetical protein AQJ54_41890 [Streptomyces griseorubiginosus]